MDHPLLNDPRLIEAMEVCRPGSDDVADPALRELADAIESNPEVEAAYERLQAVDSRIAAAFSDVPVPEELQDRILKRLAEARADAAGALAAVVSEGSTAPADGSTAVEPAPVPPKKSRRWLLAGGGGVAAIAATVALIVFILGDPQPVYDRAEVWDRAIGHFRDNEPGPGRTDAEPDDFPLSTAVARGRVVQWRWVSELLGARGVAYDLRGPRGVRATLYVLPANVKGLPARPLRRPFTTRGCSVEAWQQGSLVYVLVVDSGNRRIYQQFLGTGHSRLT